MLQTPFLCIKPKRIALDAIHAKKPFPKLLVMLSDHKIKMLREKLGLCQEFISSEIKISQANYSRIESCKVKAKQKYLIILARLLKVQPGELLDDDQDNTGLSIPRKH